MLIYLSLLFPISGAVPFFKEKKYLKGIFFSLLGVVVSLYAVKSFGSYGAVIGLSTVLEILLVYYDLNGRALPGRLPAIAYFSSLVGTFFFYYLGKSEFLYTFCFVVIFFVTLREFSWVLLEKEGLGDADPSVAPLFFFFYPVEFAVLGILFSSLSALIHYAYLYLRKEKALPVPLIPHFLTGSAVVALLLLLR